MRSSADKQAWLHWDDVVAGAKAVFGSEPNQVGIDVPRVTIPGMHPLLVSLNSYAHLHVCARYPACSCFTNIVALDWSCYRFAGQTILLLAAVTAPPGSALLSSASLPHGSSLSAEAAG